MISFKYSIVTIGLSHTVSEINSEFSQKSPISPRVFCAPTEGVPLGIGYWWWGQKTRMMGYGPRKKFRRCVQPSGYNAPRQTLGDSKNCACA